MDDRIDVFVRCWPQSKLRVALAEAVMERVRMDRDARLWVIVPAGVVVKGLPQDAAVLRAEADSFAASSRARAEAVTNGSPIYCVLDDDQLPVGADWVRRGADLLAPGLGMLSSWSVNGEVLQRPSDDPELFYPGSLGTPCWVRRGEAFAELPPGAPAADFDLRLCDMLRRRGLYFAFASSIRHNHLGYEYSQVVAGHWGA